VQSASALSVLPSLSLSTPSPHLVSVFVHILGTPMHTESSSIVHVDEQPSLFAVPSSSHVSPGSIVPSPQLNWHMLGTPVHSHPISMVHVAEQPSPPMVPPSSQDSAPVILLSPHIDATQILPGLHIVLVQSALPLHVLPLVQVGQVPPPQSISVSVAFFTPSVHVGAAHACALHTPLVQSAPDTHSTHAPAPLHVFPVPPLEHIVPDGRFVLVGVVPLQLSNVQGLLSSTTSEALVTTFVPPRPLHCIS
jgi:hypothetical protein